MIRVVFLILNFTTLRQWMNAQLHDVQQVCFIASFPWPRNRWRSSLFARHKDLVGRVSLHSREQEASLPGSFAARCFLHYSGHLKSVRVLSSRKIKVLLYLPRAVTKRFSYHIFFFIELKSCLASNSRVAVVGDVSWRLLAFSPFVSLIVYENSACCCCV